VRTLENKDLQGKTWFFKWFLNSKTVTGLIIILLFLLNVFMFTKVRHFFDPVEQFFEIVGLPIILSVIMYYMLNPIIKFLEKRGIKRLWSIIGVYLALLGLIIWGIVVLIPIIQTQTLAFFENFPRYVRLVDDEIQKLFDIELLSEFRPQLDQLGNNIAERLIEWGQTFSQATINGLGNVVGTITTVVIGIVTMPFILFFLLKDGDGLLDYLLSFLPRKWHKKTGQVLGEVNNQIASYIRGQLTVALSVAIMFTVFFSIIGLDFAVVLGITAGVLNLIPYLGSFLAMVPAFILAIVAGPMMVVKLIIVFIVEQTIEGRVVSPLVLGSQMKIHPVTIILVLLTSGKIAGVPGVIVGIPVYATIRVIISHFYEWYRDVSGIFADDRLEEVVEEEVET